MNNRWECSSKFINVIGSATSAFGGTGSSDGDTGQAPSEYNIVAKYGNLKHTIWGSGVVNNYIGDLIFDVPFGSVCIGGMKVGVVTIDDTYDTNGHYDVRANDMMIRADTSSGSVYIDLPAVTTDPTWANYFWTEGEDVTVLGQGAESIGLGGPHSFQAFGRWLRIIKTSANNSLFLRNSDGTALVTYTDAGYYDYISYPSSNSQWALVGGQQTIATGEIEALAVTTAKIANDAVDKDKLNDDVIPASSGLSISGGEISVALEATTWDKNGTAAVAGGGNVLTKEATGLRLNVNGQMFDATGAKGLVLADTALNSVCGAATIDPAADKIVFIDNTDNGNSCGVASTVIGAAAAAAVTDTAHDLAADSFVFFDATDSTLKRDLISDFATAMAGIGLTGTAGVFAVDNVELATLVTDVAHDLAADSILIYDATDSSIRRDLISDFVTAMAGAGLVNTANAFVVDPVELGGVVTEVVAEVANDSIAIYDATDSSIRRDSIADIVTAFAGVGLSATAGVLAVDPTEFGTLVTYAVHTVIGGDEIVFYDATDSTLKRDNMGSILDDATVASVSAPGVIDPTADYFFFGDAGTAFTVQSIDGIVTALAGAGISNTASQFTADWVNKPFCWSFLVDLNNMPAPGNVVDSFYLPFNGNITKIEGHIVIPTTDADADATLNLELNGVNVTGGILTLGDTGDAGGVACTPVGSRISGTAVSAAYSFTTGQLMDIESVVTNAFADGQIMVYVHGVQTS